MSEKLNKCIIFSCGACIFLIGFITMIVCGSVYLKTNKHCDTVTETILSNDMLKNDTIQCVVKDFIGYTIGIN